MVFEDEEPPPPKYDDTEYTAYNNAIPLSPGQPGQDGVSLASAYPPNPNQQPNYPPMNAAPQYSHGLSPPPYGQSGQANSGFIPSSPQTYYPPPPFYPNQYPPPTNGPPPQYPLAYYYAQQPGGGQQQSSVILVGGAPPGTTFMQDHQVVRSTYVGQIILACFAMWFCGFVFGFIALTLAIFGQNSANKGDHYKARSLSKASVAMSVVGIALGIATIVIVGAAVGTMVSRSSGCYNYYTCGNYYNYY